jgi:hypothetical protein
LRNRKISDNLEADIGFTGAGVVDTAAISAHIGSSRNFLLRDYNQLFDVNLVPTSATTTQFYDLRRKRHALHCVIEQLSTSAQRRRLQLRYELLHENRRQHNA